MLGWAKFTPGLMVNLKVPLVSFKYVGFVCVVGAVVPVVEPRAGVCPAVPRTCGATPPACDG